MAGPFSEGEREGDVWLGAVRARLLSPRKREERREAKRSSQPRRREMAFSVLSPSPPPLPLPSATATATAASYLSFSGHDRRRRRRLEHGCRCGRPPETALGGSSDCRGSYDDEEAAPGPLGLDGSSTSFSDRRTGEPRRLSYIVIVKQFVCVVRSRG